MPGGDAAVLLALDEQRVEDRAAVVDGDVADDADLTGVEVDLDDGDVGAERERRVALVEVVLGGEDAGELAVAEHPGRRVGGAPGEVGPRQRAGRHAGDADRAGVDVDDDVGDVGLEQVGGESLGLARRAVRSPGGRPIRRAAASATRRCRRRSARDRCHRRRAGCGRPGCRSGR